MNCNTIPVRTLPGRTLDSTRCRRCDEQETLLHVLGFCHLGELLRINRHNTVRSLIESSIRLNASYEVYEEVGCVSSEGSTRRADIIIIDRQKDKGVILDPTIRFEMHEQQPQETRSLHLMLNTTMFLLLVMVKNRTTTTTATAKITVEKTILKHHLALREKHPGKITILQHDNAWSHTDRVTVEKIRTFGWETLPQSPYSPDLAPSEYHLFGSVKEQLRNQRYETLEDIRKAVRQCVREDETDFYSKGILKLTQRRENVCKEKSVD
ncbi:hypothetical protein ANN_24994 [Periplaneta americana]|uniref:Uncharacterized protein n=1 Tax=Periplaneta americana TaxID=6978 RepID=A0ABQ8S075_PERAM|nr:hypothetical protein ANN_24994 [Periplaneta americana]